jgi:hypothetical protein
MTLALVTLKHDSSFSVQGSSSDWKQPGPEDWDALPTTLYAVFVALEGLGVYISENTILQHKFQG